MANLILKPSTGGVLKIQNDAGTVDALSVSTAGGLTAAGTLAVTGNTTLAGTANNLGTVTAGNISNTAIVYPGGHILQVVGNYPAATNTGGQDSTIISQTITGLDYSNNDVLIVASGFLVKATGAGTYFRGYICGGSLGTTTGGEKKFSQPGYNQDTSVEEVYCMQHIDTAPPSASETYSVYLQSLSGATIEHMRWSITVYEIKR